MAESNQVEALLAAAVAPGPGIITDDREIAPPPEPNAAPAAPKADAGVTEPTRELSPEEADIRRLMKEMEAETAAAAPAGTPPAPAAAPAKSEEPNPAKIFIKEDTTKVKKSKGWHLL